MFLTNIKSIDFVFFRYKSTTVVEQEVKRCLERMASEQASN